MNTWQSTDDRFNRAGMAPPIYLTEAQACRFERIRQSRMLYRGWHTRYYIGEKRSMWKFAETVIEGRTQPIYVRYNLCKRISHANADLMFGEEPLIHTEDEIQQGKMVALSDRTNLHALFIELEIELSHAGEGFLEAVIYDNEVYLVKPPAETIHPVGNLRPDGQYAAYVRYAEEKIDEHQRLILETTYLEGAIQRRLFRNEVREESRVSKLDEWPAFKGRNVQEIEKTNVPFNTIIWFPNLLNSGDVLSDYDDLLDLQDTLNAKETSLAYVFDRHSRPKIIAPRAAADEQGNLRVDRDVLYSDDKDDWRYLTWEARVEAAQKDRDHYEDAMCIASDTAPVLLGIYRGGAPESARAMRLRAHPSSAKAKRKVTLRRPLLKWALTVAQLLEQTIPGNRFNIGSIGLTPRDGLPIDDSEQATMLSTLKASELISLERGVSMLIPDPKAAAQEVVLIKKNRQESMPSVLLDEPMNQPIEQDEPTDTPPDGASTEAA